MFFFLRVSVPPVVSASADQPRLAIPGFPFRSLWATVLEVTQIRKCSLHRSKASSSLAALATMECA